MIPKQDIIIDIFNRKINVLLVDDEPAILEILSSIITSTLFNFKTALTVKEAVKIIDAAEFPWHCWIIDINIERREDGFNILKRYPTFPFAIMLSGLRSMTLATKAMELGAIGVSAR